MEEDIRNLNGIGTVSVIALATTRNEVTNRQAGVIATGFLQDLIYGWILPSGSEYLAMDPKINTSFMRGDNERYL